MNDNRGVVTRRRILRTRALDLILGGVLACVACGSEDTEPASSAPDDPEAETLPSLATQLEPLGDTLARFEGVDECVRELRAAVPTDVTDAIHDLGYRAIFRDICVGRGAVRDGDPSRCDELAVRPMRESCRTRVAIVHRDPDACPRPLGEQRSPMCLAWATGLEALCVGERGGQATRCRAVLDGDRDACDGLDAHTSESCGGDVVRYSELLEERHDDSAPPRRQLELRVGSEVHTPPGVAHGVHAAAEGCHYRIRVDPGATGQPSLVLDIKFEPPPTLPWTAQIDGVTVRVSIADPETIAPVPIRGELRMSTFSPERGGRVVLEAEGQITRGGASLEVHARIETVIIDIDELTCG